MSNDNKDNDFVTINLDANDRISSTSARRPQSQTIVKSSNWLVSVLGVVSVIAITGCIYLYLELVQANQVVDSNTKRLESLEARLSATGEEMDSSTATLQVKVTELAEKTDVLWSEMDKLWASAWRTNQKQIKDLDNEVSTFKSDTSTLVNSAQKEIQNTKTAQQQLIGRIDSLNNKLSEQANNLLAAKVEQEALLDSKQATTTQIRDLNEKIILLERRNTNLLQQLNELKQLVDELVKKTV